MFRNRMLAILAAALCLSAWAMPAAAVSVDSGSVYCFTREDFSGEDTLSGICITSLPDARTGTVMLGTRVLRPGDILTAQQVSQMTFHSLKTETDTSAEVGYLPIYPDRVAPSAAMSIAVMGKEDKAPIAEDSAVETYKNLPVTGKLKVSDPEGEALTYTITRQSRRGTVTIGADGSFSYTPKKNKVGVDSFTFTAADPAGKVSREATVTITILKPALNQQYSDTVGSDCRFEAEWMKNTGIFVGEKLAGQSCFSPERTVSRGEFLTMLVKALEIPMEDEADLTGYTDEIPQWLQPYLAAAVRSGLTAGLPEQDVFGADTPITGAEAAVMLQNALDLPASVSIRSDEEETLAPVWAETALTAMAQQGLTMDAQAVLNRAQAAKLLYHAVKMSETSVFME